MSVSEGRGVGFLGGVGEFAVTKVLVLPDRMVCRWRLAWFERSFCVDVRIKLAVKVVGSCCGA